MYPINSVLLKSNNFVNLPPSSSSFPLLCCWKFQVLLKNSEEKSTATEEVLLVGFEICVPTNAEESSLVEKAESQVREINTLPSLAPKSSTGE